MAKATTVKAEKPVKTVKKDIVLYSTNKALTIAVYGVQFIDGKYITTDRQLADKLLKYDAVIEL